MAQGNIDNILDFWFGELNRWGMPVNDRNALWFGYQQTTDQLIEQQFGELVASALAGKLNDRRLESSRPGVLRWCCQTYMARPIVLVDLV